MLAIPKNLVYIFVAIVLFAFAAMCWITYTEKDLAMFLKYERSQEVVIVDPLFTSLKKSLIDELDKTNVASVDVLKFNEKTFFDDYLSESRALVVKHYASQWPAINKWADKQYLTDKSGHSKINYQQFSRFPWMTNKKTDADTIDKNNEAIKLMEKMMADSGRADGKFS